MALVEQAGARAISLKLDTGDTGSFDSFVESTRQALRSFGAERFDFLVNNAGNSSGMGFQNATEDEFDLLYRIHVKGVFFLSQKLVPLMNDGGRIVNISSGLTRIIMPHRAAYGTMKAAVETMTKYMALELGERGIAVNCVAPRRYRDGLQRRRGARQSGRRQGDRGDDGTRPPRPARRYRPNDRLAPFRG